MYGDWQTTMVIGKSQPFTKTLLLLCLSFHFLILRYSGMSLDRHHDIILY